MHDLPPPARSVSRHVDFRPDGSHFAFGEVATYGATVANLVAPRRVGRCSRPVRSAHASNTSVNPGGTEASSAITTVRPPHRKRRAASKVTAK